MWLALLSAAAFAADGSGRVLVEEGGVFVGEAVELPSRDGFAEIVFDGADKIGIKPGDEGDGVSAFGGPSGATDPVNVVIRVFRDVVIDDVRDAGDVDPAGGNVRGHHDFGLAGLEEVEGLGSLGLGPVRVDGDHFVSFAFQIGRDVVSSHLGPRENNDAVVMEFLEHGFEELKFLVGRNGIERVVYGFGGLTFGVDLDFNGILEGPIDDVLNLGRDGGGEDAGLVPVGAGLDDPADIGKESHIEHAVAFIEDDGLNRCQVELAGLEVIEEAARSGDEDVRFSGQLVELGFVFDPAVKEAGGEVDKVAVIDDGLLDLGGQLPGGLDDEDAWSVVGAVRFEAGNEGQGKGGGLSGSGLGGGDDIVSLGQDRDGLGLDRGGFDVSEALNSVKDIVRKTHILK